MTRIELMHELDVCTNRLKQIINNTGLEYKEEYTQEEVNEIKYVKSLNRKDTATYKYRKIGYIPQTYLEEELNTQISNKGLDDFCINLGINKPVTFGKFSYFTKEDSEKIREFYNTYKTSRERRIKLTEMTLTRKFGVKNIMQLDEQKEIRRNESKEKKLAKTVKAREIRKEWFANLTDDERKEYLNKIRHTKCTYRNIAFDSKWEVYFYFYLIDNNIPFERQVPIKYNCGDESNHTYYCDFKRLDTNELIEIKGNQFIKEDKLYNPYSKQFDDTSKYKMECMKQNNVAIISKNEIKFYKDYFTKYSKEEIIKNI